MPSATRKKIAVVIPKYGLVGGAEGFAAELTERIALNPRYEMHVFANRWIKQSDRIVFHKIPIIGFPKFLTTMSFACFAQKAITRERVDLIHSHERIFHADIFTMHGIPHHLWVSQIRKKRWLSLFDQTTAWVEKKLVNDPDCRRFLPVSNLTREMFIREYGFVEQGRLDVIHPGVDLNTFRNLDHLRCRKEIRHRFGIEEKDVVILFVSMNFDVKGLDHLLATLGKLCAGNAHAPFRLLIVGRGDEQKYRGMAKNLGVEDRLTFTGVVQKDLLDRIYLSADIYAMMSAFDTFGMVVLEAMAASLPVIISGNVGARDIVREGVNGYVIENAADIGAISSKIALMTDDEKRREMGREACRTALDHSWDSTAEKTASLYEDVLREKGFRD